MNVSGFTFDNVITHCPACLSHDLDKNAFISNESTLSVSGFNHAKCNNCGTYFVNPQPTDESLKDFYAHSFRQGDDNELLGQSLSRYFDPEKRDYFIKNRVNPIKTHISKNSSVLDIGCGTGVFVRYMLDEGFTAHGIDIHKPSIEYGQKNLDLQQKISNSNWVDFGDEKFDLITVWTVIEHLKDPQFFLDTIRKNLNRPGFLLIEYPTVDSLQFKYLNENFFWVMPPYHLFLFSKRGIEELLRRTGYHLIETRQMPFNWYFVDSICRKNNIRLNTQHAAECQYKQIFQEIDRVFDQIAYDNNQSSTVYSICRLQYDCPDELQ